MKKRSLRNAALRSGLGLSFLVASGGGAGAQCDQQIRQTLQNLGLSEENVQAVEIERRQFTADPRETYDYNAWIDLQRCPRGNLVVHMTDYCYVQQVYTDGDCGISGVTQY